MDEKGIFKPEPGEPGEVQGILLVVEFSSHMMKKETLKGNL